MNNTTIRVVTETEELESLARVWDSLLPKCRDDNSIYLTHEWLSTWWKHFGERKKLNILLIEKGRQVIGIVPLMKTEYRIGLIKLDYDPHEKLEEQGFSRIYASDSVDAFLEVKMQ